MVFGLYDIRGVYGKDLTDDFIYKIGLAIGKFFENEETIGIIRDVRPHSIKIKDIIVNALLHTHNVLDFGIGSTPEAHYLAKVYTIPLLVITASHNPIEYNGIKIIKNNGDDLNPNEINKIKEYTFNVSKPNEKVGKYEEENGIEIYKWYLRKKFKNIKGYRIGYNPMNSVMSLFKDVLLDLGNEVYSINDKLKLETLNHPPDPSVEENLIDIKNLVINKKLDFGFAFDGDGDRIAIIDNNGKVFPIYTYPLIFKEKKIVLEVSLPIFLRKEIKDHILSRTGRIFVREKCKEYRAFMGVEYSGHIFFSENDYIDDGLFAGLRLIKELKEKNIWFNNIKLPEFEYKIINKENGGDLIEKFKKYFENKGVYIHNMNGELDGIEIIKEDYYRILIRKSQTENKYRIIMDIYKKDGTIENLEIF